jgi:tetratricopeptide (TPR) repeat protein
MLRWFLCLAFVPFVFAQDQQAQQAQPAPQKQLGTRHPAAAPSSNGQQEVPPEEDKDLATQQYSFNPLQSVKDIGVGDQYFKNHKYRAAELRYTSATKWNEGNAEAWLKLGEVEERLKDSDKEKAAYQKYLDLTSDSKKAPEIRKKLEKLK